jgi:putative PIN family toxin of toxin-antitoxin system
VKVFLDTNVLVSAVAARCPCADLFRYLVARHEVLVGEVVLQELRRALATHFRASEAQIALVDTQLRAYTLVPRPAALSTSPLRDPDDAWVFVSAVSAEADLLMTGDQGLLMLGADAPLPILSP